MTDADYNAAMSDPALKWWSRRLLPRDPAALDRLADAELAVGRVVAAERLAELAAGMREGRAP
jgi:hypothetical protein